MVSLSKRAPLLRHDVARKHDYPYSTAISNKTNPPPITSGGFFFATRAVIRSLRLCALSQKAWNGLLSTDLGNGMNETDRTQRAAYPLNPFLFILLCLQI